MGTRYSNNVKLVRRPQNKVVAVQAEDTNSQKENPFYLLAAAFVPDEPGFLIPGETKRVTSLASIPVKKGKANKTLVKVLLDPIKKYNRDTQLRMSNGDFAELEIGEIFWRDRNWTVHYEESVIQSPTFRISSTDGPELEYYLTFTTEFDYQESTAMEDVCWKLKKYLDNYSDEQNIIAYQDGFPSREEITELLDMLQTIINNVAKPPLNNTENGPL